LKKPLTTERQQSAQGKRRKEHMNKNPTPFALVKDAETGCFEGAASVKHVDCALYNECLDVAIKGNWKGFGCSECKAYCEAPQSQKYQNMLGLLAMRLASDNVIKMGHAGRTFGVKPGVDAKVRKRLKIAK
jgi:hypothetical protein